MFTFGWTIPLWKKPRLNVVVSSAISTTSRLKLKLWLQGFIIVQYLRQSINPSPFFQLRWSASTTTFFYLETLFLRTLMATCSSYWMKTSGLSRLPKKETQSISNKSNKYRKDTLVGKQDWCLHWKFFVYTAMIMVYVHLIIYFLFWLNSTHFLFCSWPKAKVPTLFDQ